MGNRRGHRSSWWTDTTNGVQNWIGVILVGALVTASAVGVAALTNRPAPTAAAPYTYSPAATPSPTPTETPQALRVAAVGDSHTESNSADFAAGKIGTASWLSVVLSDDAQFVGGWADGGTTSTTQRQNLKAPSAPADVFFVMTGTNDLAQGVDFETTEENISSMVGTVAAPRVVLLAIPPRDTETNPTTSEYNADLRALAERKGWEFFDGLEFARADGGGYVNGLTSDGVHMTFDAQQQFGRNVDSFLHNVN